MLIKIDNRETALLEIIRTKVENIPSFKSLKIVVEPLPLGDIIISDETEDKVIIERKSISDLLSSIKDGRYEEQSYRLNGLPHHNHNIIYLVEGDVNRSGNRFKPDTVTEKMTAYSAMFSLNYYKGFSVFRSFSLEETANIVCNMAYKIGKELALAVKTPYYSNSTRQPLLAAATDTSSVEEESVIEESVVEAEAEVEDKSDKDYISVVKKIKKDNITRENIGEIMLCQIPGISSVTATAVLNKYKSISNLIKELESNADSMKDLSYVNAKGQTRKISKTCISNIAKFLLT